MKSGNYIFNLETLRDIGFSQWDPIGLARLRDQHEDEYDSYLLQAAGLAIRGNTAAEVSEFLLSCCHEMGVEANVPAAGAAAQAIVGEFSRARAAVS